LVRYLLDRGLDPNSTAHILQSCQTQYRVTPLMEGSRVDDARTVALLLRRGANLEARDSFGFTAAMIAAQHGSVRSLKLLLDRRADVRTARVDGWTALSLARHNEERAVVDLLRGAGENP
jgi:ankyrin repeat protein